jgi:hypothetical protein
MNEEEKEEKKEESEGTLDLDGSYKDEENESLLFFKADDGELVGQL